MSRRWRRRLGLLVLALVAVDQGLLHTLLVDGVLLGYPIAPFDPPLFHERQRLRVAALRESPPRRTAFDPDLGWAPRPGQLGRVTYDAHGARVTGAGPAAPGARRLALIGCSFTHGDEVAAAESWAGLLDAARDDLAVWNHAVGAYGLDQALLRLRRDVLPRAPDEVWLGWAPFTSLRATTHFPPLQNHWTDLVLFKPRFLLEPDGALRLVSNPARGLEHTARLLADQAALLEAIGASDLWVRRAPRAYAPRGRSWTHHSALGRLVLTALERGGRGVRRWLEDPGSEPARLVEALVRAAAADCAAAGVRFRLLVLPGRDDLAGPSYWRGCTRRLEAAGVEVLDVSGALREAGAVGDADLWMPGGHYAPATGALVARALGAVLD